MTRSILMATTWFLLLGIAGCTITGPPAGGTPYGLGERSHGRP